IMRTQQENAAVQPLQGVAEAEQNINDILKDSIISLDETKKFADAINTLEKARAENQKNINDQYDKEGTYLGKKNNMQLEILTYLDKAGAARAQASKDVREQINLLQVQTSEYSKQLDLLQKMSSIQSNSRPGPGGKAGYIDFSVQGNPNTYSGYVMNING